MSPKTFMWLLVALVVLPAGVGAQENSEDPGFYIGGAIAIGIEQFDIDADLSNHDEGVGLDFWSGYRLGRFFAIEGNFVYMRGFQASLDGNNAKFNTFYFTANLKLYPLAGRIRPYLVSGVGGGRFESKFGPLDSHEKGGVFRFGGGVEINFGTPVDFVAGADYLTMSGLGGADHVEIKLGFQRKF
jgi:opacity protein-like surface antigen